MIASICQVPSILEARNRICIDPIGVVMNVEGFLASCNIACTEERYQSVLRILLEGRVLISSRNTDAKLAGRHPLGQIKKDGVRAENANVNIALHPHIGPV